MVDFLAAPLPPLLAAAVSAPLRPSSPTRETATGKRRQRPPPFLLASAAFLLVGTANHPVRSPFPNSHTSELAHSLCAVSSSARISFELSADFHRDTALIFSEYKEFE
ncbi:hypothetical protein OUZ56_007159 [Daphnia magna]|uniref:Uncharacterized protein n=1 Tax=Daphnia magna TaxID=35525 RepID=A0ABQ9YXR3_9CRUS|nr:hypothetical protein OUZ56_007159 [Daphnia magna]